ncbi:MAG: tRNA lysidine(34) synthetase TilS [Candidatus Dormibacteria bacterium]
MALHGSTLPPEDRTIAITRLRRRVARLASTLPPLHRGAILVVAVSGGPDSMALLDIFARLAPPREWTIHVAHVNHGLREDAARDGKHVADAAEHYGLQFHLREVEVKRHGSIQANAREARYAALRSVQEGTGAGAIVTGHTADDQVETVLMRALSSGSPKSIGAMRYVNDSVVRPLLSSWKHEILSYCAERDIHFLTDPSNTSSRYMRNRLRHEVIPALEQVYPAAKRRLWALAFRQQEWIDSIICSGNDSVLAEEWERNTE